MSTLTKGMKTNGWLGKPSKRGFFNCTKSKGVINVVDLPLSVKGGEEMLVRAFSCSGVKLAGLCRRIVETGLLAWVDLV